MKQNERKIKSVRVVMYLDTPGGRKRGESSAANQAEAESNLVRAEEEVRQAERAARFGFNAGGCRVGGERPLDLAVSCLASGEIDDDRIVAALGAYGASADDVREAICEYEAWDQSDPSEWRYTEACLTAQAAELVRDLCAGDITEAEARRKYPQAIIVVEREEAED